MKTIAIILIIGAIGFGAWKVLETKPDDTVPAAVVSETSTTAEVIPSETTPVSIAGRTIDNEAVRVSFKGFGPGKEHTGSFSDVRSVLSINTEGEVAGSIVVGMDSMTTDNEAVTKHLKTNAFFDVAKYPTATFTLTGVAGVDAQGMQGSGVFTIHGIQKAISFPIVRTSTDMKATFTIDMKAFGINQTFANETIELSVVVPFK